MPCLKHGEHFLTADIKFRVSVMVVSEGSIPSTLIGGSEHSPLTSHIFILRFAWLREHGSRFDSLQASRLPKQPRQTPFHVRV